MGLLTTAIAVALLELTFAPIAWSVMTEMGHPGRDVLLRISPLMAVGSLSLVGLVSAFEAWGLLAAAIVLGTSPRVQDWTRVCTRRLVVRYGGDREETRRRFDEIVAHGFPALPDDDLPPR
jgi:hypothetical protein